MSHFILVTSEIKGKGFFVCVEACEMLNVAVTMVISLFLNVNVKQVAIQWPILSS